MTENTKFELKVIFSDYVRVSQLRSTGNRKYSKYYDQII